MPLVVELEVDVASLTFTAETIDLNLGLVFDINPAAISFTPENIGLTGFAYTITLGTNTARVGYNAASGYGSISNTQINGSTIQQFDADQSPFNFTVTVLDGPLPQSHFNNVYVETVHEGVRTYNTATATNFFTTTNFTLWTWNTTINTYRAADVGSVLTWDYD